MSTSIFAFIVVLGVLIFAHEFGHFIVARLCGVGVLKFSLGFGSRLIGKKIGITDYRISAIPLGGYVKMVGEEPNVEVDEELKALSFTHKHVIKRMLIVAAGPVFNLLLAVVIFFFMFLFMGSFLLEPSIGKVGDGTPAQLSGLKAGDRILAINDVAIESFEEMAEKVRDSNGSRLNLSVSRNDEVIAIQVAPKQIVTKNIFGEDVDRWVMGVTAAGDVTHKKLGLFQSMGRSITETVAIFKLTAISVVKIIQGTLSAKNLGGPIMIAEMAGQQAKAGAGNLLFFIGMLSINLAILNFLPIPVLDGGHLMFFFIELIIRRPVSIKVREYAQQAGIFVLVMLMVLVFYNDISRLFSN